MMSRYYSATLIFLSCYVLTAYGQLQTVNGTIHIHIGTTAGCSVAQRFMSQVGSTFNRYGKYVNFEFTPWGRTIRGFNGSLICQFGEPDCWANRVHRCALNFLQASVAAQVRYMLCEFSAPFPALRQRSLRCVQAVGINTIAIDYCVSTPFGDTLEEPARVRSLPGMAVINRLPFIVFNDNPNLELYNQALSRLENVVCNALAADPSTSVTRC